MARLGRGTTRANVASQAGQPRDGQLAAWARPTFAGLSASARISIFAMLLAGVASAIFFGFLLRQPAPAVPISVPWIALALGFMAAELKVVDVHFRREKHSFSLGEVPLVLGFFLLTPTDFFLAMLAGTGAAFIIGRQPPLRLVFNLSNFAFIAAVAMAVFYFVHVPSGEPDLQDWLATFAATSTAAVVSSLSIAAVISMSGGAPQFQKLPEMIQFGAMVAVANTSLALLAVSILWIEPRLLALLAVPLLVVFLAYRAYVSEREKHLRLELLYQSSRILQDSPELDSTLTALLEHAREMFRAERAEVLLWPKDEDGEGLLIASQADGAIGGVQPIRVPEAHPLHHRVSRDRRAFLHGGSSRGRDAIRQAMAVPLLGESGLIGSMIIANRLTEGTNFGDDDLRLLETLANQVAVALENGQLEQSLSELSRLKEELHYQAFHDPLTGLPNRSLFIESVDVALATADGQRLPVVLFLDLDNFKDVNDMLGHAAGDQLLAAVARRIRTCIRDHDLAVRLGGDEFAILVLDDPGLGGALSVATRVIESMGVTFPIEGQDLKVTASIGIAASQGGDECADDLLRNADVAMYTAKHGGKNRFSVFEPTMHSAIVAHHSLSTDLSRGIANAEIDVFYQPVVVLETGIPYGAEALARWRHPTRGIVEPNEFIQLAEESGAILELGRAVLFEACREASTWRAPTGPLMVTVNLSAAQLGHSDFVHDLVEILRATGLPADRLVLEMTETAMFHDTNATITRLSTLRDMGVKVAIDDFGTGYSSLGYLRRFPVDILKIAREFVADADVRSDEWAFAHAIVALGRTLGLRIVAEGIEREFQLAHLSELGCELGQGFLFARPMPGEEIAELFGGRLQRPLASLLPLVA